MPLPEISHCVICEDIRLELRNLFSLMGVYGATPHAAIKLLNFEAPATWCFVFFGGPVKPSPKDMVATNLYGTNLPVHETGQSSRIVFQLRLLNSRGFPIHFEAAPSPLVLDLPEGVPANFWFRINARFTAPGTYMVSLVSEGQEYFRDTFRLDLGYPHDFR